MSLISTSDLDAAVGAIVAASNKVRDQCGLLRQQTASRSGVEAMARRSVLYLLSEAHGVQVHEIPRVCPFTAPK
jgi:hypothetical protein